MVREKATGAGDGVRDPGCDRLVDGDGAGGAVVRGSRRVWFAMLALGFVSLAVSLTVAFPVAFAFSLSPGKIILMEGTMALLVEVAVAVEAATGVERLLVVHSVWLLEASKNHLTSTYDIWNDGLCGASGGKGARQTKDEIKGYAGFSSDGAAGTNVGDRGKGRGLSLQLQLVLSCGLCCTHASEFATSRRREGWE